jgi:hypothetical protein
MKISPLTIQFTSNVCELEGIWGSAMEQRRMDAQWTTVNVNFLKSVVGAVLIWTDMDMK